MNTVAIGRAAPAGIPGQQIDAGRNNDYAWALASGDPRLNAKPYDRPGLSRGAAQWNQAGIDAAKNVSEGIANTYGNALKNLTYNANTQLQGQQQNESTAQSLAALQQQQAYNNQMAALQRQQMATNLYSGLLGGLFS